ncbi:unnamed protein product, partial [Mesorhabditis spiculigera]
MPGALFRNGSRNNIFGNTEKRYVVTDANGGIVWKVYILEDATGEPLEDNCKNFEREASHHKRLSKTPHPNIRTIRPEGVKEFRWEEDGWKYGILIFDYLPHVLDEVIANEALNYTSDDVITAAFQLAEGIYHLHYNMGITHRDIKPANVFLDNDGILKLSDFDISLNGLCGSLPDVWGTPRYMYPEQIVKKEYDCRDDLWSMGVVLRCFAGLGKANLSGFYEQRQFEVPPLLGADPLGQVIARCCPVPIGEAHRITARALEEMSLHEAQEATFRSSAGFEVTHPDMSTGSESSGSRSAIQSKKLDADPERPGTSRET